MYAVIKTGGKQYKVAKNDVIVIEKLTAETGTSVEFTDVLVVGGEGGTRVGAPTVDGARVTGTVLSQQRGEKVIVFKKRRRKNSRRKNGHRQSQTVVRISDIVAA
jgi:large subunit ribosomal protein L21